MFHLRERERDIFLLCEPHELPVLREIDACAQNKTAKEEGGEGGLRVLPLWVGTKQRQQFDDCDDSKVCNSPVVQLPLHRKTQHKQGKR